MNKILVINYPTMKMGGIEVNIFKWMEYYSKKDVRVVWYATSNAVEDADFVDILHLNVEIKNVKKTLAGLRYEKLENDEGKDVVMLSFDPLWYLGAESLRRASGASSFIHYMVLPHFTGAAYYPEENCVTSAAKKHAWMFMRRKYGEWDRQGCLRAFNEKQCAACAEHYAFTLREGSHLIPYIARSPSQPISRIKQEARERAKNRDKEFRILVCSRLDFPHKGYVLGMVDAFESIKPFYPNVTLVIAGDGPSRDALEKKVNALPVEMQSSVELLGTLGQKQLMEQFSRASVNPNLAGALVDGAISGVPSLPMRHYTDRAECYGFYEDTTKEDELNKGRGKDVRPYIERLINMPIDEYVDHCVNAVYRASEKTANPADLFSAKTGSFVTPYGDIWFGRMLLISRSISARLLRRNQFV